MKYIDTTTIYNKRVLLRVDFNVALRSDHSIANDARITQALPTIRLLLENNNRLILISHLGRPEKREVSLSLAPIVTRLKHYLPTTSITLISDFHTEQAFFVAQLPRSLAVLENIRYFPKEEDNDKQFAEELAALGDVYVNDAFSVSHRNDASIVTLPLLLPSFAGLLFKKEVSMLQTVLNHPRHPFVAIIGGSKISTKIKLLSRLLQRADTLLLAGGLANTFLRCAGVSIGKSIMEPQEVATASTIIRACELHHTALILPTDVVVATSIKGKNEMVKHVSEVKPSEMILDIGPQTQAVFGNYIQAARMILWNGPVGYFEHPHFRRGTDFVYERIIENSNAFSVVGGGETLTALAKKEHLDRISHVSTGGGAMLAFIEHGTLPGIQALEQSQKTD